MTQPKRIQGIQHIYVICSPSKEPEKFARWERWFQESGFAPEYAEILFHKWGDELTPEDIEQYSVDDGTLHRLFPFRTKLRKPEISLAINFIQIFEKAAQSPPGPILVLESDALLHPQFISLLEVELADLHKRHADWDLFSLGCGWGLRPANPNPNQHFYRAMRLRCTDSLVFSERAVKLFHQALKKIKLPIDHELELYVKDKAVVCYWLEPPIVAQGSQVGDSNSTIQPRTSKYIAGIPWNQGAPKETLEEGWKRHQSGDHAGAESIYRQALLADPRNANAWCYLGMACHDQDRFEEAVSAYLHALEIQPNFPTVYNNLGNTYRQQRRLKEALASFDQAIRLQPNYVNAIKNRASALLWEGYIEEAFASFQDALRLAPEDADTRKNVGVIHLLKGRFAEGWKDYEDRWKVPGNPPPKFVPPRWDGSPLKRRSILLVGEQGLGDTIHFVRYAGLLKERFDCQVIVSAPRALLPLLQSCPGPDRLIATGDDPGAFDVWAPLLSLPGILRHHQTSDFPAAIPYLAPTPERLEGWREKLQALGGIRIGLAWQGNRQHQADRFRSVPLAQFAPLGKLHGLSLLSLQKSPGDEQIENAGRWLDIACLGEDVDAQGAFTDTAAIMRNLDLVITSDTAIGHLAGALGVPVWLALSRVPDWRWLLDGSDSPWYPTMRLFRQPTPGDWPGVFEQMVAELLKSHPQIRKKRPDEYRLASAGPNSLSRTRHGLLLFPPQDDRVGRWLARYGEFSEGAVEVLLQVLHPGDTVVEAGANLGAHAIPLARKVGPSGRLLAFEPRRDWFQMVCGNAALNGLTQVDCRHAALGAQPGTAAHDGEPTAIATIDGLELPRCQLIKVNASGKNLDILKGAEKTLAQCRPLLYLQLHPEGPLPALIEHLQAASYRLYWHVYPLFRPQNYFENPKNELGQILSVNILGIHASVKSAIQGLREIEGPQSDWRRP